MLKYTPNHSHNVTRLTPENKNNDIIKKENMSEKTMPFYIEESIENNNVVVDMPMLDLNADSSNPHSIQINNTPNPIIENKTTPLVLRQGFNIHDRIKKVNNNLDDGWKNNSAYLVLTQKIQHQIESQNDVKKFYRFISFDNVSGVQNLLVSGQVKPEIINANEGLALRLVVASGSTDMARLLFKSGGNANIIDPTSCYCQEMADVVIQARLKMDKHVPEELREKFGVGMPKSRYSQP